MKTIFFICLYVLRFDSIIITFFKQIDLHKYFCILTSIKIIVFSFESGLNIINQKS